MPFANVGPDTGNGVRLQWARDSHVSVVVAPFTDKMPEEDTLKADTTFWAELNRTQINDLIRHLRTARDQAFGKDE